jgi:single-strand selective monofunctional uracil DNA glycosylase
MASTYADRLVALSRQLARRTANFDPGPSAAFVYHPLAYAWRPHELYLRRYGKAPAPTLLIGMNPGPFGMAQTGVPFGEVELVRDWLGLEAPVDRPEVEHPKRPVLGFDCHRREVSGSRLWGWARDRFKTPETFFSSFFVWNYCPLVFMKESGANLTPDQLPAERRAELFAICDDALAALVDLSRPRHVIGIGGFAEARIRAAVTDESVVVGRILHPSPASPIANRGWAERAEQELAAIGAL